MQKVLTAAEMREVDRQTTEKYGIPSILLMENAAHAAARIITEKLGGEIAGKSVLILCGKGNNGGDGAALARILWTQGADVDCLLFGNFGDTKGDARTNLKIIRSLSRAEVSIVEISHSYIFRKFVESGAINFYKCSSRNKWDKLLYGTFAQDWDIVIDAIFGTGLSRPLDVWLRNIVHHINFLNDTQINYFHKKRLLVSIDLSSGLNADLAEPIGETFQSDLTVTFTAPKLANVFPPASNFGGELVVANIGSPQDLIDNSPSQTFVAEKQDARNWLDKTKVKTDSYKKTRGTALIIAGSADFSGAAILAANACFAAGAGIVSLSLPHSIREIVAAKVSDEIIVKSFAATENGAFDESAARDVLDASEKMNVAAVGCGLSSSEASTRNFVRAVVEKRRTPIIIDADGLNSLAPFDLRGSDDLPVVLTPHIGEFQRLLGTNEVVTDRIETARAFAAKHNIILLLKGERSIVAAPDGTIVINPTGNAGIARAGSGDTLTGIITGFLAQTFGTEKPTMENTFETVVAALYVSGLAGDIAAAKLGQRLMTATDIRDCLGEALQSLEK